MDNGKFLFIEKAMNVKSIGNADTMNVMMEFSKETDETPPNLQQFLKENVYMTLAPSIENRITMDPLDWKILVEFVKGKTIREVIFGVCSSYEEGIRRIDNLLNLKVLQVSEKPPSSETDSSIRKETERPEIVIPSEKLEQIREILTTAMGPMGEFLVDETLEEIDLSSLSTDTVSDFIDTLLSKIPDSCLIEGESCRDRLRREFKKILIGGEDET